MVTIGHIHRGLSAEWHAALARLTTDKVLLVLGYSGFDHLDILPALQRSGYREVLLLWIHHTADATEPRASASSSPWAERRNAGLALPGGALRGSRWAAIRRVPYRGKPCALLRQGGCPGEGAPCG
ncbi:hypothetical protein [Endothiovibrio diazotrophicus]